MQVVYDFSCTKRIMAKIHYLGKIQQLQAQC